MGGWPGPSPKIDVIFLVSVDSFSISAGRTPKANAAASEAGRLAAKDEMIFFKNL